MALRRLWQRFWHPEDPPTFPREVAWVTMTSTALMLVDGYNWLGLPREEPESFVLYFVALLLVIALLLRRPVGEYGLTLGRWRAGLALTALTWLGGDAYVVHPLNRPAGSFLLPFLSLGHYDNPILINLHLQPTQLSAQESQDVARAAGIAQTAGDWQKQDYGRQQSRRFIDPQAQLVAQIYTSTLRRLDHAPYGS